MEARRTKIRSIANTQQTSTPAELVDALNLLFGKQVNGRAVHAKGIVLTGRFSPTTEATKLSKAPHFSTAVPRHRSLLELFRQNGRC